ncbi:MFS general substrate transporter [Sporormia fimetaria CBS 119925]|uniref:MFS general substrate transporter n=1 Tax=Sporormia fimetaria CBS 119925 TaxID=1340428 RepID=A0A6A6VJZ1_9PLEO|nr:MFS general substrate transporter [Sporormia fimetaria CBS 119925]
MSLVQHVHPNEGTDREEALVDLFLPSIERHATHEQERERQRRFSIESGRPLSQTTVRRVVSYDALKPPEEPTATEKHGGVTQYHVSTVKRLAQVITTVLACWFASGIVFGFAALKPILVKEGVFRDLCEPDELDAGVEICFKQDLRLNFFFSLASTTANVSALPIGYMLDRYGPMVCFLFGSLCLSIGSILMSLAFRIPDFDGYTIGNFFLALGGSAIFLPSFQIANAFPQHAGTIVATVTGAFDASAAVFLFYRLAYDASEGRFKPDTFFLLYLVVPVAIAIAQLTFLPKENYKTVPQLEIKIAKAEDNTRDVHDSDDDLLSDEVLKARKARTQKRNRRLRKLDELVGGPDTRKHREEKEEKIHEASGVWGALHNKSAKEQMLSPWFYLLALLTVFQMIRMNYFIATIREQYDYMLDSMDQAARINEAFDWLLPLAGVISTPFLGVMLDSLSTSTVLMLLTVVITAIGVFNSIPLFWAGLVNVLLFVFLRPFYYSAMSDYAAKVFGFATFGRVYGSIICFSGVVNLCQTAIVALTKGPFHGNPLPVNAFLTVSGFLVGTTLFVYVGVQSYRMRKKLEEEDRWTYTNTDAGSVLDSLLEEDEPVHYGSINRHL